MLKKMGPTDLKYFGVLLTKILVAIATVLIKIMILGNWSCHGNQLEYVHHENSTQKF